ncbi:MAG: alkaline phosphatase family protein [Acidobacteria bacterium]|nr:alkaline phosphatase family protein [Acidobacteriota bacterium]
MRYLRVLTNSAIASALLSAYLTMATLHLNPAYPLSEAGPLAAAFALAYGANAILVFYALVVLRQVAAVEVLSPGWLSVRVLAWMCTISASVGATVLWLNAADLSPFLAADTARRMSLAAIAVAICGGVFLIVALAHIGRRGTAPSGVLLVTTMALSVAVPLTLRGSANTATPVALPTRTVRPPVGPDVAGGRVVLLAVDGASLDHISLAVAEGRLPNFGRLLDAGASAYLATLRPTQAEPIWTTVATGRMPQTSGVRSAARYVVSDQAPRVDVLPDYVFSQALVRYGFLRAEPHGPDSMASMPLWRILSERGVRVGVIGWPLTHPAPPVRGYVVSDVLHRVDDARFTLDGAAAVSPPSLWTAVAAARALPLAPDPRDVLARAGRLLRGAASDGRVDAAPAQADSLHLRLFAALEAARPSRFVALRLPGLDAVAHYFLRFASPEEFGDVTAEEHDAFGTVLDDYYAVLDAAVGRLHESLGPDDLVIVVSSHGIEPLTPVKRILERLVGDDQLSGTHERAPDGFVMAMGPAVQPGRRERGSVADIAPTVLYFLGLPIGRDMDGRARSDFFTPAFTATRPVTFIPGYGR